jgi:hypothetical protein
MSPSAHSSASGQRLSSAPVQVLELPAEVLRQQQELGIPPTSAPSLLDVIAADYDPNTLDERAIQDALEAMDNLLESAELKPKRLVPCVHCGGSPDCVYVKGGFYEID